MAAAIFKKGTPVFVIRSWDNAGTVAITSAVVDSWGAQQLHLRLPSGDCTKHRYYTARVNTGEPMDTLVLPATIGLRGAEAIALQKGDDIACHNIARVQECLRWNDAKGMEIYAHTVVRARIDEQHEPRAIVTDKLYS